MLTWAFNSPEGVHWSGQLALKRTTSARVTRQVRGLKVDIYKFYLIIAATKQQFYLVCEWKWHRPKKLLAWLQIFMYISKKRWTLYKASLIGFIAVYSVFLFAPENQIKTTTIFCIESPKKKKKKRKTFTLHRLGWTVFFLTSVPYGGATPLFSPQETLPPPLCKLNQVCKGTLTAGGLCVHNKAPHVKSSAACLRQEPKRAAMQDVCSLNMEALKTSLSQKVEGVRKQNVLF